MHCVSSLVLILSEEKVYQMNSIHTTLERTNALLSIKYCQQLLGFCVHILITYIRELLINIQFYMLF